MWVFESIWTEGFIHVLFIVYLRYRSGLLVLFFTRNYVYVYVVWEAFVRVVTEFHGFWQ